MDKKTKEKIVSTRENFLQFANALVYKAFVDRCNKYSYEYTENLKNYASIVAEHYVDKYWPMDFPLQTLDLLLSEFNYDGSWDEEGSINRTIPGVEGFLQRVEPADEFERLHGEYYKTVGELEGLI